MKKKRVKSLVLMSGGLDSILAAKILMEQGVEVVGLSFISCFFNAEKAAAAAKQLGIKLIKKNFKRSHLAMLKNPQFGYGRFFNPCIDCHLLMIQEAGKIMKKDNFDFVATGEVLGQRPFSQNKKAMEAIEESSGIKGYLLRPLSAGLLAETIPEKKGLVGRKRLLSIHGRSRQKQMDLAMKRGLDYPAPAGGCLLANIEAGQRIKEMIKHWPESGPADMILAVDFQRNFWQEGNLIVLGKNKEQNEELKKLTIDSDILIEPEFSGPSALIRSKQILSSEKSAELIRQTEKLIEKFSK